MSDEFSQKLCNERHATIHDNRTLDRQWTEQVEKKVDKINGTMNTILGGIIVNLVLIVVVYVLLKQAVSG